uniref:EF-hand domain-containing protein n=1 Tax=Acrobeloides nanus TaxID=290746 RepID=A0A914DGV0_9BILA
MSSLSNDTQEILKEIFDLYKSTDGKLSVDRVGDAVRAAGLVPTNEEVSNIIKGASARYIAFEDLCTIYEHLSKNYTQRYKDLSEGLKVLDRDENGKIAIADLKYVLTTLGEKMSPEMVDEILDGLQDGSSYIDILALCKKISMSSTSEFNDQFIL